MTCDYFKVTFLDVQVMVNPDGCLISDLYRKPSAANAILHAISAHPTPLRKNIPYGQNLNFKELYQRGRLFDPNEKFTTQIMTERL